jgi:hypothetical protein
MSSQLFGTATIRMNGETLRTKAGAKHTPGGPERTAIPGARAKDVGYSEANTNSMTECEVMIDADFDIEKFRNARDVTVLFETDTGQTFIQKGAWCVGAPQLSDGGAGAAVKFEGPPSIQA